MIYVARSHLEDFSAYTNFMNEGYALIETAYSRSGEWCMRLNRQALVVSCDKNVVLQAAKKIRPWFDLVYEA